MDGGTEKVPVPAQIFRGNIGACMGVLGGSSAELDGPALGWIFFLERFSVEYRDRTIHLSSDPDSQYRLLCVRWPSVSDAGWADGEMAGLWNLFAVLSSVCFAGVPALAVPVQRTEGSRSG